MKITKQTSRLIILKDTNIVSIFTGIILISVGILAFFYPDLFTNEVDQFPWYFRLLFPLIGAIVLLISKTTKITLDKGSNKVLLISKKLIGDEHKKYYELKRIKKVLLQKTYAYRGEKTRCYFNIILILDNNEKIKLPSSATVSVGGGLIGKKYFNKDEKIGEKIAKFLEVPFEKKDSENQGLKDTISELKKTIIEERLYNRSYFFYSYFKR